MIPTLTGARSSVPATAGSVSVMVMRTDAACGGPSWLLFAGATATVPIEATTPLAVVCPSGMATDVVSPTLTNGSRSTHSWTRTVCTVDVACRKGWPGSADTPALDSTLVTRIGPGM